MVKSLPAVRETRVQSLGQKDPLKKEMATHSSILAWKSHGWRSLAGYSPWGHKESDTTERLHFLLFFFYPSLDCKLHVGKKELYPKHTVGAQEIC